MRQIVILLMTALLLYGITENALSQDLDFDKSMQQRWEQMNRSGGQGSSGETVKYDFMKSPFIKALMQNNLEEVKRFLNQNPAYIYTKDDASRTPLHFAAMKGSASMIELLITRGAQIDSKDKYGFTPLNIAEQYGNNKAEKALHEAPGKIGQQRSEGGELCFAAARGDTEKARAFLEKNKELINLREQYSGWTPLHWALTQPEDSLNIVEFMVSKGGDVNAKDINGITPFALSIAHSKKKCAEYFLSKGADINTADIYGNTALHGAILLGNDTMENFLLDHNANVNIKGEKGFTPLHVAAWKGKLRLLKPLVEKGADITIKDNSGYTALMISSQEGFIEMVKYLVSKGGNVNERKNDGANTLMCASAKGKEDVVVFLIEKGAEINAQSDDGRTPLRYAVEYDQMRIVKLLISKGADVNISDKEGITPLKRALQKNNAKITDTLKSSEK